jgi:hypothetical protein
MLPTIPSDTPASRQMGIYKQVTHNPTLSTLNNMYSNKSVVSINIRRQYSKTSIKKTQGAIFEADAMKRRIA